MKSVVICGSRRFYDPLGHYSSTFASKIEGSYNNFLRGIPLEMIPEMLFSVGYQP